MIPYDKREGKIWYNGDLVDWQDAKLHVISHGLHYASLVFEGIRIYDGEIFKLEEHTDRLYHSAKRMDIKIPFTKEEKYTLKVMFEPTARNLSKKDIDDAKFVYWQELEVLKYDPTTRIKHALPYEEIDMIDACKKEANNIGLRLMLCLRIDTLI